MQVEIAVQSVEETETKNGNTRYVVRDGDGREYSTFRPAIGREAKKFEPFKRLVAEDIREGTQPDDD